MFKDIDGFASQGGKLTPETIRASTVDMEQDDAERETTPEEDTLPELIDWEDLCNKPMIEPKHVITDCARLGHLMATTGSAKTNKSWTIAELIHAVATGGKFMGRQCLKGNVLAVDLELGEYTFKHRLKAIIEQTGVAIKRGYLQFLNMEAVDEPDINKLIEKVQTESAKHHFVMVAIDPVYTLSATPKRIQTQRWLDSQTS
jgi:RecA-family ATPase